jgi:hypothetical protein
MGHPRLKAFIYILLRDELTIRTMERILEVTKRTEPSSQYGNRHLELYSEEVIERLLDDETNPT